MDRFRKNLRDSFRKKRDHVLECSKPYQWQADEAAVRLGTCCFTIKYLGCVEVFESRGMQVCEEALKVLRNCRRRQVKVTMYITGDGLRVVDDETKALLVDQTIEKVSFCAPDRNHEKGFAYICRDGTTRRWMCHGFMAIKDSGERLSHAVGCAFAVCLERKQKRDKETVVMTFDPKSAAFTRTGSFRQASLTERMQDPQECKPAVPPPLKPVRNPFAIERPHATASMLHRQGSFRGFSTLNQTSPFKRQLSLRLNELPSTLERQKAMALECAETFPVHNGKSTVTPVPEASVKENQDTISVLCQQVSQGLSFLSNKDDPFFASSRISSHQGNHSFLPQHQLIMNVGISLMETGFTGSHGEAWMSGKTPKDFPFCGVSSNTGLSTVARDASHNSSCLLTGPQTSLSTGCIESLQPIIPPRHSSPDFTHLSHHSSESSEANITQSTNTNASLTTVDQPSQYNPHNCSLWNNPDNGNPIVSSHNVAACKDPFDAEWAAIATRHQPSTNPFSQHSVKAFEVHM